MSSGIAALHEALLCGGPEISRRLQKNSGPPSRNLAFQTRTTSVAHAVTLFSTRNSLKMADIEMADEITEAQPAAAAVQNGDGMQLDGNHISADADTDGKPNRL
jgi:hypothetical protein